MVVASFSFVGWNISQHDTTSAADEYVYIDYFDKVPDSFRLHNGEPTGNLARQYALCHGIRGYIDANPAACEGALTDEHIASLPFSGETTADIYTPTYFMITKVFAYPLSIFTGGDLVNAARLTGALWLAGAGIFLSLTLSRLRVSRLTSVLAPLAIIGSVPAYTANTYLSTDAPALLIGSALTFLAIRYFQTGRGLWWIPVISVIGGSLKLQNLAITGVVVLTLVSWALFRSSPFVHRGKAVVASALATVIPVAIQLIWTIIRASDLGSSQREIEHNQLGLSNIVSEVFKFLPTLGQGVEVLSLVNAAGIASACLLSVFVLSGFIGAASTQTAPISTVARSSLFMLLVLGPLLAIAVAATEGYYFELPIRYALTLLPPTFIAAAVFFETGTAGRVRPVPVICSLIFALGFVITGTP